MLNINQEARITGRPVEHVAAEREAQRLTEAWHNEQITALGFNPHAYTGVELGTREWTALPTDSPERLAAVLIAARAWVRRNADMAEDVLYESELQAAIGREHALDAVEPANELARQMAHDLARTPSFAERVAQWTTYPLVREVRATPDWTPVAIPGRPGWWRHCLDGRQVDLPTANATEAAA